jgi:flagellar motor switch protein FliM
MRWNVTVQDPQRTSARRKRSSTPELYDFRRPMTLSRDHARALEMAFETFSRQWGTQLTSRLRIVSNVALESVSMLSYDEYVRSLPEMTTVLLCTVEQTRSTAILELPLPLVMTWVDFLLGGPGRVDESSLRELTEIELTLVKDLLRHVLANIAYAFAGVMPLDVSIRSVQYNPQFVQAAPASEPMIVATFSVHMNETEMSATFAIPADVMLAGLRAGEDLDARSDEERDAQRNAHELLTHSVREVPVDVSVRFTSRVVHPRDVVELSVGDVVPLSHHTSTPLDVVVGGVVMARAAAGTNGNRLACMVVTVEENT